MQNPNPRRFLLAAAVLISSCAAAQDQVCTVKTMFTLPGRAIQTYAQHLAPSEVRIKLGKREIREASVTPRSNPLNIVIQVDTSSSQTQSIWAITLEMLHSLLVTIPLPTRISLGTFDDEVKQQQPLASEGDIRKALAVLTPSKSKTTEKTVDAALAAGVSVLGGANVGDVEILVTARDRGQPEKYKAAQHALLDGGVRLFVISFDGSELPGAAPFPIFISDNRPTPLGALARQSGGVGIVAKDNANPTGLAQAMAGAIGDVYEVTAKLGQPIMKPETLKVEVKGHATIFYPAEAGPCR